LPCGCDEEWSVALSEDRDARLRCYRNALRNWKGLGYVEFKKIAESWVLRELAPWPLRVLMCDDADDPDDPIIIVVSVHDV
jgi:hypothetical protein